MASAPRALGFPAQTSALRPLTLDVDGDLHLRPLRESDKAAVTEAMTDPGILRWAAGLGVNAAPPDERARIWLLPRVSGWSIGTAPFGITDLAGGDLLGYVSLRDVNRTPGQAVAAYWVTPAARGRRVAARALNAVAAWAFAPTAQGGLGLHRISLDHSLTNEASCHVATAAGFRTEGTTRESFLDPEGIRHDSHVHGRLATDPRPPLTPPRA
ncbi:GNAT family N-acetyltransferase [Streptomyces sp. NBC_01476]|uniref:GNAT family N-acetyltransferase n=1 Tax=Streptomyces sp. NBC_01476 TaxID=2903881 RepID=UPI002E36D717|nr:GNAT family N-acetyltransferase [Streptomyces sp. NBC_01476]